MESISREVKLMEGIAECLKIWFQNAPGDESYPSGTVDLRYRNGVSLAVESVSFDKVLTWLRVNDHKEIARSLEQEGDSFLSDLQAVEQAIERGDNPHLLLIELRSKITYLIGSLEDTAKLFIEKIESQEKGGQSNGGKVDSPNEKSSETWYWKLYEKTIKAVIAAVLDKVNPS